MSLEDDVLKVLTWEEWCNLVRCCTHFAVVREREPSESGQGIRLRSGRRLYGLGLVEPSSPRVARTPRRWRPTSLGLRVAKRGGSIPSAVLQAWADNQVARRAV